MSLNLDAAVSLDTASYDLDGTPGAAVPIEITATQTQTVQILYAVVTVPTQSGGTVKKPKKKIKAREPLTFVRTVRAEQSQTVSLSIVLEPLGLSLVEDDEEALLLLI